MPLWRRLSIALLFSIVIVAAMVAGGTWLIERRVDRELERLDGRLGPDLRLNWSDVRFDPLRWETLVVDLMVIDGDGASRMAIDSLVVNQWSRKGGDTRIGMSARGLKVDEAAFGEGPLGMAGRMLLGAGGGTAAPEVGPAGTWGRTAGSHVGLSLHHSTLSKRLDLESLTLEREWRMELSVQMDSVASIVASDSVPLLERLKRSVFVRAAIRLDGLDAVGAYAEGRALKDGTPSGEVRVSTMRLVRMAAFMTGLRDRDAMESIEAFVMDGAPIGLEIESRAPTTWNDLMRRFDENMFSIFDALSFRVIGEPELPAR